MSTKEFSKNSNEEFITPHRVTVAILIYVFTQYRESESFQLLKGNQLHCKYRRDFAVLIFNLLQKPDLSLEELRDLFLSDLYFIPKEVINSFDEILANIYTNGTGFLLDNVDNFSRIVLSLNDNTFSDSKDLSPKASITKNSVIGYYIRRLIVYFDNLTFSEVTEVYLSYQRHYEKWKKCENIKSQIDVFSDEWCSHQEEWSRRQAELFIATQSALLSNNEEKALNPLELQKRISNLLRSNPDLAEAHFLSYLNFARLKEFCGAFDSLYYCFDKAEYADKNTNEEKTKGQRYAALNLAILHYQFGHNEEALASLKESIKMSQEANDNVCLQQALCWLYRLTNSNKDKLISQCTIKSFELNLTYTKSLGLQTCSKFKAENAGNPHIIFEVLAKSDLINYQHNHRDLISSNFSMKSALWQFYGKTEMSSLWSQLFLYLNIDTMPATVAFYGESFCLSICSIANFLLLEGEYAIAHSIINFARQRYPNEPHSLIWMMTENLFVYTKALLEEDWSTAESAAQKLIVINKFEGYLRLSELYYYKEDYSEANRCLNEIFKLFNEEQNIFYYIRSRILLAEIQFASSYPDIIPAGLVTILEDCLIQTNNCKMQYYTSMIHLQIVNIQLTMGLPTQALKLMRKCLVQVLSHGGVFDRARAKLLYVKCLVADSSKLNQEERKPVILEAAKLLDNVKTDFEKIKAYSRVNNVLYLQAQLYNTIGMTTERNKAAYEFKLLEEEHPTKNTSILVKYL